MNGAIDNISDGWDIYRSWFVTIQDSNVLNDDDCVCTSLPNVISAKPEFFADCASCFPSSVSKYRNIAFKPNSTNIQALNMNCDGSHGISVGSLGQYAGETDIVANVTVKNILMKNAQNGARIKVFGGSGDPSASPSLCSYPRLFRQID